MAIKQEKKLYQDKIEADLENKMKTDPRKMWKDLKNQKKRNKSNLPNEIRDEEGTVIEGCDKVQEVRKGYFQNLLNSAGGKHEECEAADDEHNENGVSAISSGDQDFLNGELITDEIRQLQND